MKKKCSLCLEKKEIDCFNLSGRPDGSIHAQCKDCRNRQSREYVARAKKQNQEGYLSPVTLQSWEPPEEIENFNELNNIF